jgi:D-glycero-alpha-D-manno-heptose-7-phosphate kinase
MTDQDTHLLVYRARAPLRVSFAGGGTDVSPYSDERGGRVLNATINRYCHVTLIPNDSGRAVIHSVDYDKTLDLATRDLPTIEIPDRFELPIGVARRFAVSERPGGFDLYMHADCPPGSGLGASSTMVVALIGVFDRLYSMGLDRYEIARLAYEIERTDLGIRGGRQDQYAACFGGFNFMEFEDGLAVVNPLRIPADHISELEYTLVLAHTGQSRYSSGIIQDQISNYAAGRTDAIDAMDETRRLAIEMKRMLLKADFDGFGEMLDVAWAVKKKMSDRISTSDLDRLYGAARDAGAVGGKVTGAGGGGFMLFYCRPDRRYDVLNALRAEGAEPIDFGFTDNGLQTWTR